jgi:hypothetical protein
LQIAVDAATTPSSPRELAAFTFGSEVTFPSVA